MLKGPKKNLLIGGALVLVGFLNLLANLDFIYIQAELVVAVLFLSAAGFLFWRFRQNRRISFLVLSAIAAFAGSAVLLEGVLHVHDEFIGVLFLWGTGALFGYGFLRNSQKWGFAIPAGVFFTLGLIVLAERATYFEDGFLGALFFLGLAATFGFLNLIKDDVNKLDWSKYPALILAAVSGMVFLATIGSDSASLVVPLLLIVAGGYLVYQNLQHKTLEKT